MVRANAKDQDDGLQLGLRTLFDELRMGASMSAAAIGSVIARMAQPGFERAARRWLGERSALGELLGVEFATFGPMRLYRASDLLREGPARRSCRRSSNTHL